MNRLIKKIEKHYRKVIIIPEFSPPYDGRLSVLSRDVIKTVIQDWRLNLAKLTLNKKRLFKHYNRLLSIFYPFELVKL